MRTTFLLLSLLALTGCDCGDDDGSPGGDAGQDGGDDGGDGGRIPGREVRVPAEVDVELGAVVKVPVTVVAGTAPWLTTILVTAPRFVYIEGQSTTTRPVTIDDAVELRAGQQKDYQVRVQTLLTWDHSITVNVNGEMYEIPIHPTLVPPLIGVADFGCDGPHEVAYGPDCGPCGLETTVKTCADTQPLDLCHPIGFRVPDGVNEEAAKAACDAGAALPIQITDDVPASFWTLATDPETIDVSELTWVAGVMRDQLRTRPAPVPGVFAWWMMTCPDCVNADGSRGPYDPANAIVFDGLQAMGNEIAIVPGIVALQIASSEQVVQHLCPCLGAGTECAAVSGPSQPSCAEPDALHSEALGVAYGPLVAAIASRVGTGVHATSPDIRVISAPVDDPNRGLSPLTRVALENDLASSVDALGVASTPYPAPTWLDPMPDCAIGAPGCETAPPFADWTAMLPPEGGGDPVATTVHARDVWQAFDLAVDPAEIEIALVYGGWDALPLWYSSIRAGFHGTSPREAIAGLRIATILAAERAAGMTFAFPPTNAEAYELLVRTITGTHPVRRDEQPEGYDDLVLRFLSRDGEDVLVAWNNGESVRVAFLSADEMEYGTVTVTRVQGGDEQLVIRNETLDTPETQLSVMPLSEIVIMRVDADEQIGFRWLQTIQY